MPWWSWVLIWVALAACTVVVLLLSGIYLFRKGMGVVRGASSALEQIGSRGPAVAAADDGAPSPARRAPGSAVFADPARMRREYDEGREARRLARRDRRIARRRKRGQRQSLRDLGLL